jgi:putative nucleotidyltransferase with HDIG domain
VVSIQRLGVIREVAPPQADPFDHRRLERELGEVVDLGQRTGIPACLLLFDVRGTATPDEEDVRALIDGDVAAVRSVLAQELPSGAATHRYGSDELAVVCIGMDATGARELARRVCARIARSTGSQRGAGSSVVVGIAPAEQGMMGPNTLLARAEAALTVARGSEIEPIAVFEKSMSALTPGQRLEFARSRALRESVRALAQAVDDRNPSTANHSASVSELATALAQVLGLEDSQVQLVGLAALVHDVGKVATPDSVFALAEPSNGEEAALIQAHPVLGERILASARLDQVLPLVRHHHERWDGTGYPDGLSGHDIPLGARILGVCDGFEAATAGRPGRVRLNTRGALELIRSQAGSCYDPVVAGAFGRMIDKLNAPLAGGSGILD